MKTKNKFEQKIYKQLKKAKVQFKYEGTRIPYILSRHYIPDFVLQTPTGLVYIECKGYLRPEAKSKMVAVKRLNPQLDIRMVFYAPVKSSIKWAIKNGFKYAVGQIPKEWLIGL